ncbi:MAG TPA: hypothetical protein VKA08_17105 [Balneolales bacterium]|nr:hypothetical protein [Balneolales bacterium]
MVIPLYSATRQIPGNLKHGDVILMLSRLRDSVGSRLQMVLVVLICRDRYWFQTRSFAPKLSWQDVWDRNGAQDDIAMFKIFAASLVSDAPEWLLTRCN